MGVRPHGWRPGILSSPASFVCSAVAIAAGAPFPTSVMRSQTNPLGAYVCVRGAREHRRGMSPPSTGRGGADEMEVPVRGVQTFLRRVEQNRNGAREQNRGAKQRGSEKARERERERDRGGNIAASYRRGAPEPLGPALGVMSALWRSLAPPAKRACRQACPPQEF